MTSGNGLTLAYTAFNKPATIARAAPPRSASTATPSTSAPSRPACRASTFYIAGAGVLAERFARSGGTVRWTNDPMGGDTRGRLKVC